MALYHELLTSYEFYMKKYLGWKGNVINEELEKVSLGNYDELYNYLSSEYKFIIETSNVSILIRATTYKNNQYMNYFYHYDVLSIKRNIMIIVFEMKESLVPNHSKKHSMYNDFFKHLRCDRLRNELSYIKRIATKITLCKTITFYNKRQFAEYKVKN